MAKTKRIKFELLVVTEDETKKSWKPSVFWRRLVFTEADTFVRRVVTIAAIIFVYALIIYSDDLTKRILKWLVNILLS